MTTGRRLIDEIRIWTRHLNSLSQFSRLVAAIPGLELDVPPEYVAARDSRRLILDNARIEITGLVQAEIDAGSKNPWLPRLIDTMDAAMAEVVGVIESPPGGMGGPQDVVRAVFALDETITKGWTIRKLWGIAAFLFATGTGVVLFKRYVLDTDTDRAVNSLNDFPNILRAGQNATVACGGDPVCIAAVQALTAKAVATLFPDSESDEECGILDAPLPAVGGILAGVVITYALIEKYVP